MTKYSLLWRWLPVAVLLSVPACVEYDFSGEPGKADATSDTAATPPMETTEVPDEPLPTSSVSGKICDTSGGVWVVGAKVWVEIDDDGDGEIDRTLETTTDAEGAFTLDGLPAGEWILYVEKGSFSTTIEVSLDEGENLLTEPECLQPDVRIAVFRGDFDSIEGILTNMGLSYDMVNKTNQRAFLLDPAQLNEYDLLFLNCGMSSNWLSDHAAVGNNLRTWVSEGGGLYASDWAYYAIEAAYPDAVDFRGNDTSTSVAKMGAADTLQARVLDPIMQLLLGSDTATVEYDLDAWAMAVDVGAGSQVLVEGDVRTYSGVREDDAPLAVQLHDGAGTAIYTSFHNERQINADMETLLREIILSL
jgi:hypothetical protein